MSVGPGKGRGPKPVLAPPWAFLSEPWAPRGYWIRTDASVLLVACPTCGAEVGEPCRAMAWRGKGERLRLVPSTDPASHRRGTHGSRLKLVERHAADAVIARVVRMAGGRVSKR